MSDWTREPDGHDFDGEGLYWVNRDAPPIPLVPAGESCRDCGHTIEHHDLFGECWVHIEPDIPGDNDQLCPCANFMPRVRYDPLALEYIGAAFMVWRELLRKARLLGQALIREGEHVK